MLKDFNKSDAKEIFSELSETSLASLMAINHGRDTTLYFQHLCKDIENYDLRKIVAIHGKPVMILGIDLIDEGTAHCWCITRINASTDAFRVIKEAKLALSALANTNTIKDLFTFCGVDDLDSQRWLRLLGFKNLHRSDSEFGAPKRFSTWGLNIGRI